VAGACQHASGFGNTPLVRADMDVNECWMSRAVVFSSGRLEMPVGKFEKRFPIAVGDRVRPRVVKKAEFALDQRSIERRLRGHR